MSLYLSRLLLNPRSRQVSSEISHPYEMHRTLIRGFEKHLVDSEGSARKAVGMLFRVDADERNHRVVTYVQSLLEPDWGYLEALNGYLLESSSERASYKDISKAYEQLHDGQTLSFRLRANPTKRLGRGAHAAALKGKRVGLVREEDQIAWLERKGRNGGFVLLRSGSDGKAGEGQGASAVTVRTEGNQVGRKREQKHSHTMTHLSVVFDGLLCITDVSAFRRTLVCGIGSAKAYGFGLLSIAPSRAP